MCILDVICLRFEPHMCFVPRLPVLRHRAMRKYCILRASQGKHQIQKVTRTTMLHLKHVSKYIYIFIYIHVTYVYYTGLSPPLPRGVTNKEGGIMVGFLGRFFIQSSIYGIYSHLYLIYGDIRCTSPFCPPC